MMAMPDPLDNPVN